MTERDALARLKRGDIGGLEFLVRRCQQGNAPGQASFEVVFERDR